MLSPVKEDEFVLHGLQEYKRSLREIFVMGICGGIVIGLSLAELVYVIIKIKGGG